MIKIRFGYCPPNPGPKKKLHNKWFTDINDAIKKGFKTYLQNELEIQDVKVNKNKITCTLGTEKIIFTVTKNDITFVVE